MDVYTMEHWKKDGAFSALPGQEIAGDVYAAMYDVAPPKPLPQETAR